MNTKAYLPGLIFFLFLFPITAFPDELPEGTIVHQKWPNGVPKHYTLYPKTHYPIHVKTFEDGEDPVFFAIISKKLDKPVGIASYLRIKPKDGSIEVGHINYSPLLQNTTEATEAMYLMMKWAFDNGYRRYEWKCNALNLKSRRAAQRLGLSYEGVFRQMTINKGRNRDTAWFAAIDKEWHNIEQCYLKFLSDDNFDVEGKPKISLSSLTKPLLYKVDNYDSC